MYNISKLEGQGATDMEEVAIHAGAIRNAFFENRKQMDDVIPQVLLVTMDDRVEISSRKIRRVAEQQTKGAQMGKKQKKAATSGK